MSGTSSPAKGTRNLTPDSRSATCAVSGTLPEADGVLTDLTGRATATGLNHRQDRRPTQDMLTAQAAGRSGPYGDQLPGQVSRLKPGAGNGIILTSGPRRDRRCGAETGCRPRLRATRRILPHPAPCSRMVFLQTCPRARGRRALPYPPECKW